MWTDGLLTEYSWVVEHSYVVEYSCWDVYMDWIGRLVLCCSSVKGMMEVWFWKKWDYLWPWCDTHVCAYITHKTQVGVHIVCWHIYMPVIKTTQSLSMFIKTHAYGMCQFVFTYILFCVCMCDLYYYPYNCLGKERERKREGERQRDLASTYSPMIVRMANWSMGVPSWECVFECAKHMQRQLHALLLVFTLQAQVIRGQRRRPTDSSPDSTAPIGMS